MTTFFVYELWNPIDNSIFYVGKSNSKAKRLKEHLNEASRAKRGKAPRTRKTNMINKILDNKMKPLYKIVFTSPIEHEALNKEIELIKFYGRKDNGGLLCNHTDGGEGSSGHKHTDEWRKNMSLNSPNKITLSKAIYAIDSDGIIFKEFLSTVEASMFFNKRSHASAISKSAKKNKHYTLFGYFWRYKDEYDPLENFSNITANKHLKKYKNKILQLNPTNLNVEKEWNSTTEIIKALSVSKCLYRHLNKNTIYHNSIWVSI